MNNDIVKTIAELDRKHIKTNMIVDLYLPKIKNRYIDNYQSLRKLIGDLDSVVKLLDIKKNHRIDKDTMEQVKDIRGKLNESLTSMLEELTKSIRDIDK